MPLTATFPANIGTNNAIDAGNTTLFASLPVMAITLSNGTQAKVSKVTVNNLPVNNDHIINKPGIYTVTLVVPDPDGIELIQNYTLTVRPAPIVKNNVNDYKAPMYPKERINNEYTIESSYAITSQWKLASLKSLASLPPTPTGESAAILVMDHASDPNNITGTENNTIKLVDSKILRIWIGRDPSVERLKEIEEEFPDAILMIERNGGGLSRLDTNVRDWMKRVFNNSRYLITDANVMNSEGE